MSDAKRFCFVIMPFTPELHYFYLYLKYHIETRHGLECERADARILTIPLLEKINGQIRQADVIIADCTGRNPNVFYELGLAHAHGKKVILITQDAMKDAPTDVRHLEFIKYTLEEDVAFLRSVDNALHQIIFESYQPYYEFALQIVKEFMKDTRCNLRTVSEETFLGRIREAERKHPLPTLDRSAELMDILLPKIIDATDANVITDIAAWLSAQRLD